MCKIILFYKKLIEPGGAERLLLNEYACFKKMGCDVNIVSMEIKNDALFHEDIPQKDMIVLGSNWLGAMYKLMKYTQNNRDAYFLCASGHIEMYLISKIVQYKYSLHIHHPSFMSFNETDKYSIFQKKHFNTMLKSNFGAIRFEQINRKFTIFQKIYINLRALFSIQAIKKSEHNFVLSKYAQKEKKILFNIDSHVLCGALDESLFSYKVHKDFSKYAHYKYRLLTIARLDENKRIDELLKAFKLFLQIEPNCILFIGGKGPEAVRLQNLSMELDIVSNVKFLGFIPDQELYDWYAMADLFISIDWADYRITMYESLIMNTKVLLSDETDADTTLLEYNYLFITPPNSQQTFKAIQNALTSVPTVSYETLKTYLHCFTWDRYCNKILTVLSSDV